MLGLGAYASMDAAEIQTCVTRPPETAGQRVGFEMIDLMRREAWVTTDWTPEDFAEFTPGLAALNWIKNDPRIGFADDTRVLRSPGCATDGEYTYQTMFGRTFFHIADMTRLGGHGLTDGALREGSVVKHHLLQFAAGQTVSFLVSPDEERFVRVNRPIQATATAQGLPEGWHLEDASLDDAWSAELSGEIRVLRLEDGTSYQGPVDAEDLSD